jgi:ABC-2 type transport system ATP-binding protein
MSDPVVMDRLTCYYGATKALDTVSLNVPEGSVFALLGRNGAGKTTAMRCLLGFLAPTRGRVSVLGHDAASMPPEERARIGYVAEGQGTVGWMRVGQLVEFQRRGFPGFDADLAKSHLDRLGVPDRSRVWSLSRGQQAQVALALALAPRPELVILDDPAMGLDAVVRREFLEVMVELIQEEGRTLLFTSHILQDVERVADRVAILDRGVLRVCGPLDAVKERIQRVEAVFDGEPPAVPEMAGVVRAVRRRNEIALTVAGDPAEAEERLSALGARRVERSRLSLEDVFIDYTGNHSKGGAA